MDVYPDNTLAHYNTRLAAPVDLQGEWEVGLAEVSYPLSWYNVRRGEIMEWRIRVGPRPDQHISFALVPGVYTTPNILLGKMKELMMHERLHDLVEIRLDPISQKVHIYVQGGSTEVYFSPVLGELLGLGPKVTDVYLRAGAYTGTYTLDLNIGFYSLYIYCDLVRARPIGDVMAPLLRSVPIKKANTTDRDATNIRNDVFPNVYFLPMQKKNFQVVEIDIRDDTGNRVPFESGKVEVTLVFRKVI